LRTPWSIGGYGFGFFRHATFSGPFPGVRCAAFSTGRPGANLSDQDLRRTFTRQLVEVQRWLHRTPEVQMLTVTYDAALQNPEETTTRLARFLGDPFDAKAAAGAIDPNLRHR
jgi:hypothetical protein